MVTALVDRSSSCIITPSLTARKKPKNGASVAKRRFSEIMIGWDPATGEIEVGPWPDTTGWSRRWSYAAGAWVLRDPDERGIKLNLGFLFRVMVIRDKMPPAIVDEALMEIKEYHELCRDQLLTDIIVGLELE